MNHQLQIKNIIINVSLKDRIIEIYKKFIKIDLYYLFFENIEESNNI